MADAVSRPSPEADHSDRDFYMWTQGQAAAIAQVGAAKLLPAGVD
jgi:hypothetical protein